jgi:hypothetical protein
MDSYLMRGLVPERVYPSVEQSQSPCAEGQTATMLEAVVAVLDVSCVVVLVWERREVGGRRWEEYPDYNTFPVMTMAKSGGGFIFWHVPGVHDGVVVTVSCGASVDLAGAGGAVTVCSSSGGEPSAVTIVNFQCSMGTLGKEHTWCHLQRQHQGKEHIHSRHRGMAGRRGRASPRYHLEQSGQNPRYRHC